MVHFFHLKLMKINCVNYNYKIIIKYYMEEITLNLEDIEKKIFVYKKHLIAQQQIKKYL